MKKTTAAWMIAASTAMLVASIGLAQNPPRPGSGDQAPPQRGQPVGSAAAVPAIPIAQAIPLVPAGTPAAGGTGARPGQAGTGTAGRRVIVRPGGRPGGTPIPPVTPETPPGSGTAGAGATGAATPGGTDSSTGAAGAGGRAQPGSVSQAGGGNLREFEPGIDYTPMPAGARITFNLQDADLPDLIRAIGNITGRRFIVGSKVRQIKATIYSPTKVTPPEAYQAFLSVLQTNGLTVVPAGRYLRIEESTGAATNPLPTYTPGQATPTDDRYITRIHRLRNMTAEDAAQLLGHFKSRDGDVTAYAATNTVIITDTASNIRRMMQILTEVDVPAVGEQVWVERVHYAAAADMARQLSELLGASASGGSAGAAGRPAAGGDARLTRITPDDRSNSLIIVATERMYLRVLELLRRLDVPIEGEGEVHVYYLQHADADELATVVNNVTGGGRGGSAGGQQPGQQGRGSSASIFEGPVRITADKRTNALIVTSSPRDYISVRRVIRELDRTRRQVFIEAVVMELSVRHTTKIGVNWHGGAQPDPNVLLLGGFQAAGSAGFPSSLITNQDALQGLALGVRGPVIQGTQNLLPGLTLGIPGFGAVLTALANSGDGDVLATPSIIATDNQPADINVGQNIPLQTNLGGIGGLPGGGAGVPGLPGGLPFGGFGLGGFAAPRQDVGTKIRVVPHINDSNEIRMDIEEEISEADAPVGALGAIPINKRNAKTTVVVQDQQTVVIGGLIRNSVQRGTDRIPILGDIPLIGALFRTERRTVERRNLLLFLTPYVIRDQSDLRRIFERKMRERQEFLDRYFVFSDNDYQPVVDYTRTNGMLEEIRQAIRDQRLQAEIESRGIPRAPPRHEASDSIDLPSTGRRSGGVTTGGDQPPSDGNAPSTGPPAVAVPLILPPAAVRPPP